MTLEQIWLEHFKAAVDKEALDAGSLRGGYRAVATKIGKSEEYIYQIYQRKPKSDGSPRLVTLDLSKSIARHYADGRPPEWINEPIRSTTQTIKDTDASPASCAVMPIGAWPFKHVSYKRFMALPRHAQREIDAYLEGMVATWENKNINDRPRRKHC